MNTLIFQDKKWQIKLSIIDKGFTQDEIKMLRDKHDSNLVLKKENNLFFLEEIPELEFVYSENQELSDGQGNK